VTLCVCVRARVRKRVCARARERERERSLLRERETDRQRERERKRDNLNMLVRGGGRGEEDEEESGFRVPPLSEGSAHRLPLLSSPTTIKSMSKPLRENMSLCEEGCKNKHVSAREALAATLFSLSPTRGVVLTDLQSSI
jgi:hypothetical protein